MTCEQGHLHLLDGSSVFSLDYAPLVEGIVRRWVYEVPDHLFRGGIYTIIVLSRGGRAFIRHQMQKDRPILFSELASEQLAQYLDDIGRYQKEFAIRQEGYLTFRE